VDAFYCNKRGNIQGGTAITERNTIIIEGTSFTKLEEIVECKGK